MRQKRCRLDWIMSKMQSREWRLYRHWWIVFLLRRWPQGRDPPCRWAHTGARQDPEQSVTTPLCWTSKSKRSFMCDSKHHQARYYFLNELICFFLVPDIQFISWIHMCVRVFLGVCSNFWNFTIGLLWRIQNNGVGRSCCTRCLPITERKT